MPRIELIPDVLYESNDPIHWEFDNLPLKAILRRQNLINLALDNLIQDFRDAIGTQGSVSNRLNQSIDADGNLKSEAIDEALHSIEEHADTDDYVRMTKAESDKLALIADGATDVSVTVYTDDTNFVELTAGVVIFKPTDTVIPSVESPNIVKLNLAFPAEAAHQHFYGLEPVAVNISNPDYINYKVNSIASEYVEGSLRVYVNGVRVFADAEVYVPAALVEQPWTLLTFTEDAANGTFEFSTAVAEDDVVRVDFDIAFV
jgi:hypothetical protein